MFRKIISSNQVSFSIPDIIALDSRGVNYAPYVNAFDNPTLSDLFGTDETKQSKAFSRIKTANHKHEVITYPSWMSFLQTLQEERLSFYEKLFLIKHLHFAGHGLEPGQPYFKSITEKYGVSGNGIIFDVILFSIFLSGHSRPFRRLRVLHAKQSPIFRVVLRK